MIRGKYKEGLNSRYSFVEEEILVLYFLVGVLFNLFIHLSLVLDIRNLNDC
jgi:hypothetical protein